MLHQYKVVFEAGNHKGGKTYIARLLTLTKDALVKANDGEPVKPAMEVIAKELGLTKEGINAEYLSIMCTKFSAGVDDKVKYLFRRIGRYVQDNGCWPTKEILRHWPEYKNMKGHYVEHPERAYTHHRDLGKNKLEKEVTKTAIDGSVGLNFRVSEDFAWEFKQAALSAKKKQNEFLTDCLAKSKHSQKQDNLAQQLAKEAKTAKEAYSHLSKESKRLRDVLMVMESRVSALEESHEDAVREAKELYALIDEATAPAPAKSRYRAFDGLLGRRKDANSKEGKVK